ncbi:hypothetical protein [Streptacidiphilus sp. EB129]|uniref:hypothetical protein n=1 Tax=Streptacidiphilus sp. EB129 TaxID=3156262 RepID=UPI00351769F9
MNMLPRVVSDAAVDWVKFDAALARDGSVDPVDKALYAALGSFVDPGSRESDEDLDAADVPTRKVLAACIGRSVDTVDRSTKRLEEAGLLEVDRRPDPKNPRLNVPSVYRLLDHERWDERAAARAAARLADKKAKAAARAAKKDAPGPAASQGGGRTHAATPDGGVAAPMRPGSPHGCGQGGRTHAAVPSSLKESLSREGGEGSPATVTAGADGTERENTAAPTTAPAAAAQQAFGDVPAQRAEQELGQEQLDLVLAAYEEARGGRALNGTRQQLLTGAAELLAAGRPLAWVVDRARELPQFGTDLVRHAEMSRVPFGRSVSRSSGQPRTDCLTCHGSGLAEDLTGMPIGPCDCITAASTTV